MIGVRLVVYRSIATPGLLTKAFVHGIFGSWSKLEIGCGSSRLSCFFSTSIWLWLNCDRGTGSGAEGATLCPENIKGKLGCFNAWDALLEILQYLVV